MSTTSSRCATRLLFAAAALALATACPQPPADTAPPAAASWVAVGDNGVSGTASTYELRYLSGASCPIDAAGFGGGTLVSGVPGPAAPGTRQKVTVSGLSPSAGYCFALKVSDEVGNS